VHFEDKRKIDASLTNYHMVFRDIECGIRNTPGLLVAQPDGVLEADRMADAGTAGCVFQY
jgi:hypothetical protein